MINQPARLCHYAQFSPEEHNAPGTVQCANCKNWYCDECVQELFLKFITLAGQEVTLPDPGLCSSCHMNIAYNEGMRA